MSHFALADGKIKRNNKSRSWLDLVSSETMRTRPELHFVASHSFHCLLHLSPSRNNCPELFSIHKYNTQIRELDPVSKNLSHPLSQGITRA